MPTGICRNAIGDCDGMRPVQTLDGDSVAAVADQAEGCSCLVPLIDRLPSDQAEALSAIDLAEGDPTVLARTAGVEINTIHARRSRARAGLRNLLRQACRACATHGCQDRDCTPPSDAVLRSAQPGTD